MPRLSIPAFFALLIGLQLAGGAVAQEEERRTPEPARLDGFLVTDGTGGSKALGDVLPKGATIVHLWATWCGPCREELPALADFSDALERRGMTDRLVVVSVDRAGYDRVRRFLDGLDLPNLHTWKETGGTMGTAFGVTGYPTTVVLDAKRNVVVRHAGVLQWGDKAAQQKLISYLKSEN